MSKKHAFSRKIMTWERFYFISREDHLTPTRFLSTRQILSEIRWISRKTRVKNKFIGPRRCGVLVEAWKTYFRDEGMWRPARVCYKIKRVTYSKLWISWKCLIFSPGFHNWSKSPNTSTAIMYNTIFIRKIFGCVLPNRRSEINDRVASRESCRRKKIFRVIIHSVGE